MENESAILTFFCRHLVGIGWYEGTTNSNVDLESVVGMSGGPIIGIRHNSNGQLAYWPVAMQSRWLPDQRIVIGSLIAPMAADVENWIQRAIDDQTSREVKH